LKIFGRPCEREKKLNNKQENLFGAKKKKIEASQEPRKKKKPKNSLNQGEGIGKKPQGVCAKTLGEGRAHLGGGTRTPGGGRGMGRTIRLRLRERGTLGGA